MSTSPRDRFAEALLLAHRLHRDQVRKGPQPVPYVSHLLGVCGLVLEAGGDEEQAIAALLHDAVEDQGGRETLEGIRDRFGDRVADMVEALSDSYGDPKPPWRERKEGYLEELPGEPVDVLLVSCADKLYNARAILRDHRRHGDAVFERFKPAAEDTLWYYRSLADAFRASALESWLVEELEQAVAALEERTWTD